jgi:predicted ribosomally synthesized peptide with SipW-like signal peptide
MTRSRFTGWNLAFLAIMLIGYAAAIDHASSDRWGNAIMAAAASTVGTIVILLWQQPEAEEAREPRRSPRAAVHDMMSRERGEPERRHWLSGSIVAGFAATIVMSLLLLIAYAFTGFLGAEDGSQVSQWFYNLRNNDLAEGALDIPIAAFSINLLAGLAWALVYGGIVERRMSGPGWLRGMLFSLVPWLLSLVAFFPAVGGGLFGMDLDAGPLPAIGNLVLHLIFGAILGAVYAIPEVSSDALDTRAARSQKDGTAIGLVVGLTVGLVAGATIAAFTASDVTDGVNITLAGGGIGVLVGGLVGSFAGVGLGTRHELG